MSSERHRPVMGQVQKGIRVGIDAEVLPWRNGGVAHALLAIVRALGKLSDGQETYRIIVHTSEEEAFWSPEVGENQTLVVRDSYDKMQARALPWGVARLARRTKLALKPAVQRLRGRLTLSSQWPEIPLSDGFYESLGCDVMHFTWQRYVVCGIPTIYNPHDLQHLHMPQLWPAQEIAWREAIYPVGCRLARTVVVGSQWAKQDILRQYRVDPDKVQVIAEGATGQMLSPSSAVETEEVRKRYGLPEKYLLYPAIMWPHKNHRKLLEALALLRDRRGVVAPLVCTGKSMENSWPGIEACIRERNLESQVHFLGFIPEADLRVIQRAAYCLVQPSLFEASSLPIFDAWLDGVPVACSRGTALPEQVGDAGLLFDPLDPEDIARSLEVIMTDRQVYQDLRERGYERVKDFDWARTAKAYRAVYRRAAGVTLNEEDRWLLQWDWMGEPRRVPLGQETHA